MNFTITRKPPLAPTMALLNRARLPVEDLTERHCEDFFHVGPAQEPLGLVGLEMFGDVGLLRSLAVASELRGRGVGSDLLSHAERYAGSHGVRQLYLLTNTADAFFAARGYVVTRRDDTPDAVRATREFAAICPASAKVMSKTIQG
jgi:amino-acid N-acetyltransferase